MVKKRKTRAQKIRALGHRHFEQVQIVAQEPFAVPNRPATASHKKSPALSSLSAKIVLNRRDLYVSLSIFACIVAIQILLWLGLHFTRLDQTLYQHIAL